MKWYGLGRGALVSIRSLLNKPLWFDAVSYIERTFDPQYVIENPDVFRLAYLFDQERKGLCQKVSGLTSALEQSGKVTEQDVYGGGLPVFHEFLGAPRKGEEQRRVRVRTCDSINLQLDRMLEEFEIVRVFSGSFKARDVSDFISFYLLSEVLFLVLTGMARVNFLLDEVLVVPADEDVVCQLHRKWFANYWEQTSAMATLASFDPVHKGFQNNLMFKPIMTMFGKNLRDKIFSIPADSLPGRLTRLQSVQWIDKLCVLTAVIMWCQLKNEMSEMPYSYLDKVGLQRTDVDWLKEFLKSTPVPDRVFIFGNHGIRIENPTITVQLRQIFHRVADKLSDSRLNELLGHFFERNCIASFFEEKGLSKDYVVHRGESWDKNAGKEFDFDIDMIVEDLSRNQFFFIQVKYLRSGGKAYISGDLDYVRSGKLSKGIEQLNGAKHALQSGALDEWLCEKGLASCNIDNSSFVLIHNIFNFDFCVWPGGVVSYEWNSLRNLFKKGLVLHGHSQSPHKVWSATEVLAIEAPDKVIEHFMHSVPRGVTGGVESLFEGDQLTVNFSIGDKAIKCQGLGL